ncbi:MAG: WD40 repeat domain-containing protein [Verrucomicrobia bacterium]|nr:WD40 repeat domain-containing protein [Verrucomicrobiota bacterium]
MESSGLCRLPRFSPRGSRRAAIRQGREVLVWDLGELAAPPAVFAHAFPVENFVFSPDGRYLASGTDNDRVHVWDIMTGTAFGPPLPGRPGGFNANGRRLLLSNHEGSVTLWDLSRLEELVLAVPPHRTGQWSTRSTDGKITAHLDGIEIFLATPLETPLRRVVFSPDHRHLVAESPDRRAWIWNRSTPNRSASRQPPTRSPPHSDPWRRRCIISTGRASTCAGSFNLTLEFPSPFP